MIFDLFQILFIEIFVFEFVQNLKGYENRRQLFTVSPANGKSNAFTRKGPLASAAPSAAIASTIAPAPWGNGSTTSTELFSSRYFTSSVLLNTLLASFFLQVH